MTAEQDPSLNRTQSAAEQEGGTTDASLQAALEAAEARALESKDLYLRALAELENVRKRAARDVEQAHRFAVGTASDVVGKSYESEVREAVKAPTQGGFYYATDAVKVKLPWAATGELLLEVTREAEAGKGC